MRSNSLKRHMKRHEGGNGNEDNVVTKGSHDGKAVNEDIVVNKGDQISCTSEKSWYWK